MKNYAVEWRLNDQVQKERELVKMISEKALLLIDAYETSIHLSSTSAT